MNNAPVTAPNKKGRQMTPGRKRMLTRDAIKAEAMQTLYRLTPVRDTPKPDQVWETKEQPLSRQQFRKLTRFNEAAQASTKKKQPKPSPLGNRATRRAKIASMKEIKLDDLLVPQEEPSDD